MHYILCKSDMSLYQTSSKNITVSGACCWQALAKQAGRMFLVQVHSFSGQALLRSSFAAGASIRRICRAVEQIAGWRRHTCRLMKEAGLSASACVQHSVMENDICNYQHPVAMKLRSCLFSSHVLSGMFLFHGHAWPSTFVHESIAQVISGFAARRARLDALGTPGEKIIFQAARAEIQVLSLCLVTRTGLPSASLQRLFPSLLLRWSMPGPALAHA